MAFSTTYTFGFATVVCVVCSTALAGLSLGLKDIQEANVRRDRFKNILVALDLPEKVNGERPSVSGETIDKLWTEKVDVIAVSPTDGSKLPLDKCDLNEDGVFNFDDMKLAKEAVKGTDKPPAVLGLYIRKDTGTVAIPMFGKGLWGPISGYVAFDPKITEVQGTSFFAPKETPGLGAKIIEDEFEGSFLKKTIVEAGKTTPIRVKKSAECAEKIDPHCVDGISGATLTSRGVDAMFASYIAYYEPYIKTVR